MRRIVINMQNALFCNAIADTLRRSGNELEPYTVDSPDKVVDDCKWLTPYALLLEVTGYTPCLLCERMKIRDAVKPQNPECKIVFIVDENAEKANVEGYNVFSMNEVKEGKLYNYLFDLFTSEGGCE